MKAVRRLALLLAFAVAPQTHRADEEQGLPVDDRVGKYAERLGSSTFRETWVAASRITLTDGADEYEAYVLSAAYLYAYVDGCSRIRTLIDEGRRWVAKTEMGLAQDGPPDAGPPIFVEKATGATTSPENTTITDPKSYLELIRR